MTVEVAVPTDYLGGVLSGLSRRQAIIIAQETGQGYASIRCEVKSPELNVLLHVKSFKLLNYVF